MSSFNLFSPKTQGTVSITSAVTTASVALVPLGCRQIRVKNIDTANVAFINFGTSSVTATVPSGATPGSIPIGPGETAGFTLDPNVTHAASICSAGSGFA